MRIGGHGRAGDGIHKTQDCIDDEEKESIKATREATQPENPTHGAVILLKDLIDTVRCSHPPEKVFEPSPAEIV